MSDSPEQQTTAEQTSEKSAISAGLSILTFMLVMGGLFCTAVGHLEGEKVRAAQKWESRKVKILSMKLVYERSGSSSNSERIQTKIKDLKTGKKSTRVRVQFGSMSFRVGAGKSSAYSSNSAIVKRYPKNKVVDAYISPDGREYLLEQNTDEFMNKLRLWGVYALAGAVIAFIGSRFA